MRHPEPEIVRVWRQGPPQVCHTCEAYGEDGVCKVHQAEPPEDFATTPNACEHWLYDIPF